MRNMNLQDLNIDKTWTLFLDRDGVINQRIIDGYVTRWEEFLFAPGVLEALKSLSMVFGRLIIVTNQQGIGKGIMTDNDLFIIHNRLVEEVNKAGGRIDKIYYSPFLAELKNSMRKPDIGMAMLAKNDFPEITFSRSIMVGDSLSDMDFGKKVDMYTVFISDEEIQEEFKKQIDFFSLHLLDFARKL